MEAMDTSLTARASNALFNQVMREQQSFASSPAVAAAPPAAIGDILSIAPPPANASPMDFSTFMSRLVAAKQEALRQAALRGGTGGQPTDPNKPKDGKSGPLRVTAHGFYDSNNKLVPVTSVRIYEVNNYSHRTSQQYSGQLPEYTLSMSDAKVGKYYKVQVTWANGYSETRDEQIYSGDGRSVDIYK